MTFWEYDLHYTGKILDGALPCPEGITLTKTEDMERAVELLAQVEQMGMAEFVRRCAAAEGTEIPQEVYDSFQPQQVEELLRQLPLEQPAQRGSAYAALLDCCALEEGLTAYLIDVLRRGDAAGFYRLSRVTTRTDVRPEAFLAWLGSLEQRADDEERACAETMDACLDRLLREGRGEVAAALIAGDEQTFTAFRRESPELVHRPEATMEWFETNYLDRYYPIRFLMRANGIQFPKA